MIKKIPTILLLMSCSGYVFALNHTTVVNDTDHPIAVAWTAVGCAGIKFDHFEVCKGVMIAPHQKSSYKHKWGHTNDHIHMGMKVKMKDMGKELGNVVEGSAEWGYSVEGNCKNNSKDGATYHISDMTVVGKNDTITINCTQKRM